MQALELAILIFGAWTLAYQLALATRAPVRLVAVPFLLLVIPAGAWWRRSLEARVGVPAPAAIGRWMVVAAGGLCLAPALLALFLARPDLDDFSFFQRATAQLAHLEEPFFLDDRSHDIPLPPLSTHHLLTAYEPLTALAAEALHLDPVLVYHNLAASAAGLAMGAIFLLLYRQVGLGWPAALLASATALVFHLLDGGPHRSYGHFGVVRLWHGKAILATVLLPVFLLLAWRFLATPSRRRLAMLAMAAVCGIGLSSSAIFMLPVLALALAFAHVATRQPATPGAWRAKLLPAVALGLAVLPCLLLGAAIALDWLPRPADSRIWVESFPATWWSNLALVIGSPAALVRDLTLVLVLPRFALRRPYARMLPAISLALIVLVANPLLGPLWLTLIQAGGYWRFALLFPVTWCAGLLAPLCLPDRRHRLRPSLRASLAAAVLALVAIAFPGTVFDRPTRWHGAWDYKFSRPSIAFARKAVPLLAGRHLLAPTSMVILPLLEPSIRLEAGRPFQTLHAFRNAQREAEGKRRVRAQELVEDAPVTRLRARALARSLKNGVDAVVMLRTARERVEPRLAAGHRHWQIAAMSREYLLFLRDEPPAMQRGKRP